MTERANDRRSDAEILLESVCDYAILMVDEKGRVTTWNAGARALTGYAESEVLGRSLELFCHPDDRSGHPLTDALRVARDVGRWQSDCWCQRSAGDRFLAHVIVSAVHEDSDGLRGFAIVMRDVTQRWLAETELSALTRQQATVAEFGRQALTGKTLGELMQSAVELIATTLQVELVKVLELLPDGETLLLRAGLGWEPGLVGKGTVGTEQASQAGYTLRSQTPVIVKDLRTETRFNGPALLSDHGVVSGISIVIEGESGPFGVLGAHTRTERVLTDDDVNFVRSMGNILAEAIRREMSEARVRGIVETAVDAIITIDERGLVESFNPAAERIFGYGANDVIGRNVSMLMPSPDLEQHDAYLERYMRTGEARIIGIGREVLGKRKNGETFPLDLSVAELDVHGRRRFTGILRDLSERKALEQELLQAQKMEAIGRLAGGIAHDFNNLLSAILHGCAMASKGLDQDSEARQQLEEVRASARRGAGLTRQLLDFSRKRSYEPKIVDLNELVTDSGRMIKQLVGEDVTLHLAPSAEGATVLADSSRLEQVLMNLAVNARDAMPKGGQIRIGTKRVDVSREEVGRIGALQPGPHVLLKVTDTGCGMDASTRDRIFDPFFTTKGPGKGTGLGLSTVYGIVRQCGGHITVVSDEEKGTTFSIFLPAVEKKPPAAEDSAFQATGPRGEGETILLVEDERLVRAGIRFHLRELGYRVLEADGSEAALKLCDEHQGSIDLLLSDIVMPGMGGGELGEIITRKRPGIRVLYMSAFPGETLVAEGRLAPGLPTIEKPFDEGLLAAKIREMLA